MNRNGRLAAGLGIVVVVGLTGCPNINVSVPGDWSFGGGSSYTDATGSHKVDPDSLPSVMSKLEHQNREIGEELMEGDWKDTVRDCQKLGEWAGRAESLSAQSRDPNVFRTHCATLRQHAANAEQAARAYNRTGVNNILTYTSQLLIEMRKLSG